MKIKNCLVILLVFSFVVCGFANALDSSAKDDSQAQKVIRRVDTEEDALEIAKEYLMAINKSAQYFDFKYLTKLEDGIWYVVFLKKEVVKEFGKVKSIKIEISQKTGEVIESKEQDGFFIDKRFK